MFGWFKTTSPLKPNQRHWINQRFDWLRTEFGDDRLRGPVVTPSDEFFPNSYAGTFDDASALFERVCKYMDVDRNRIDLKLYKTPAADATYNAVFPQGYALGAYERHDERIAVWLEATQLDDAASVVATFAHELGHVHLLADGHCDDAEPDHERLTDLFVVYFGLGVFIANTELREANWRAGHFSGWRMSTRGYLSQAKIAYALAVYAYTRNEHSPAWGKHLRKDVRALLDCELENLIAIGGPSFSEPPSESEPATTDGGVALAVLRDEVAFDPCESQLDNVEDESPDASSDPDIDAFFTDAVQLAADGQHDKAIEAFTTVLQSHPDDAEAMHLRAKSHLAAGHYAKAVEDCTGSLRIEPGELDVECCRAAGRIWLGRFSEALPDIESAIGTDHKHPYPWLLRGFVHIGIGRPEEALRDLNKAIRYAPTWAINYLARSRAYAALGDQERANTDLQEAIYREPTLADDPNPTSRLPSG